MLVAFYLGANVSWLVQAKLFTSFHAGWGRLSSGDSLAFIPLSPTTYTERVSWASQGFLGQFVSSASCPPEDHLGLLSRYSLIIIPA